MASVSINTHVPIVLTPEDAQNFLTGLQMIKSVTDKLLDIGDVDRRSLPQIGDGGVTWVNDALGFMQGNPALKPAYLDEVAFTQDLATMTTLRGMMQPLQLVMDRLNGCYLVCSNQALNAGLVFYQAVKAGVRVNLPNAASVAAEMAANYPRRPRSRAKRAVDKQARAKGANGTSPQTNDA